MMVYRNLEQRMRARSAALLASMESGLGRMLQAWVLIAGLACAARMAATPVATGGVSLGSAITYVMVVVAPLASMVLALRWFADGDRQPQPATRFALAGRWRSVAPSEARRHPLYGASGVMVSLLVGILLNVPIRAAEFFAAVPPIPGGAPEWLSTLQFALTLDVLLFTSLYAIAFVAALKRLPMFPRLLVAIWLCDIGVQLMIGHAVASTPGLPAPVGHALHSLLAGNVGKVLISVSLWLPYLLLSTRVNVTYRHRLPA
jgi:hypothetical protein